MSLRATTWQTVGPYFRIGMEHLYAHDIAGEGVRGERISVQGRVFDGAGLPIPDALLEIWQANSSGKYAHPEDSQDKPLEAGFRGFGRIPTDDEALSDSPRSSRARYPAQMGWIRRHISSSAS